jgi:hypothetical protein
MCGPDGVYVQACIKDSHTNAKSNSPQRRMGILRNLIGHRELRTLVNKVKNRQVI